MSEDPGAVKAEAPGTQSLPHPLRVVLHEAGVIVVERSPRAIDPARLLTTIEGIHHVLELLRQSTGLRVATQRRAAVIELGLPLPGVGAEPRQVAANLIAPDVALVDTAAATARGWLDVAAREARRARAEVRRSSRPSSEQRAERRMHAKIADLRAARDRSNVKVETYRQETVNLREQIAILQEDLAAANAQLSAANAQVERTRRAINDPVRLAEALAAALAPANTADKTDSRAVQAGEPPRVDPARYRPDSALDLRERLSAAASEVALPDAVRTKIGIWMPELLSAFANPAPPRIRVGNELGLAVEVLGGGTQIGGSCVLVSAGDTRVLVDAGARPGGRDETSLAPPGIREALAAPIDAIIVTHAHNDHGGWVPAILARQPHVPVFVTDASSELLSTMWFDAAKVLARRVENRDSWSGGPLPPYTRDDVVRAVKSLQPLPYGRRRRVGSIEIELFPAGHIVGAAAVILYIGGQRVVISGDVSATGQSTVGGIAIPNSAIGAELLLLESTYAHQAKSQPRRFAVSDLVRDVATTLDAGGRVLIPAFALGRAQEIALILAEHLPEVEVVIDGLARDISEVYERHEGPDGKPLRIFTGNVKPVERGRGRMEMARLRSGVVIATSGMLTSGPAVEWAERILPDGRSALMIVGYQDEDSPGRQLLDLAERGGKEFALVRAEGQVTTIPVRARVNRYHLGAHASADELAMISTELCPAQVMLVHGERHGQETFAKRLALRRQDTVSADFRWTPPSRR